MVALFAVCHCQN